MILPVLCYRTVLPLGLSCRHLKLNPCSQASNTVALPCFVILALLVVPQSQSLPAAFPMSWVLCNMYCQPQLPSSFLSQPCKNLAIVRMQQEAPHSCEICTVKCLGLPRLKTEKQKKRTTSFLLSEGPWDAAKVGGIWTRSRAWAETSREHVALISCLSSTQGGVYGITK